MECFSLAKKISQRLHRRTAWKQPGITVTENRKEEEFVAKRLLLGLALRAQLRPAAES